MKRQGFSDLPIWQLLWSILSGMQDFNLQFGSQLRALRNYRANARFTFRLFWRRFTASWEIKTVPFTGFKMRIGTAQHRSGRWTDVAENLRPAALRSKVQGPLATGGVAAV